MSNYSSKEFKELQQFWYNKLAESGFNDIEDFRIEYGNQSNDHLKRSCKDLARKYNQDTFQHFADCRNFLCHGYFSSKIDKFIFKMYTEGLSLRQIAELLPEKQSYFYVHTKLKKIKSDLKAYLIKESEDDR